MLVLQSIHVEKLPGLGLGLHIEPAVRKQISRKEVFKLVRQGRKLVANHLDPFEWRRIALLPSLEEVIEHGVQFLLRRIPWLKQIVVELHIIDCLDGRFSITVSGEQYPLGLREKSTRLLQKFDPLHFGHAVVGQEEGHRFALVFQFEEAVERFLCRSGVENAVGAAVACTQVAYHGPEHLRIIVYGEYNGL